MEALSETERVKSNKRAKTWRKVQGYFWILPAFIALIIFNYYPPLAAFFYSLTDWNGVDFSFVGFENFVKLFQSHAFYRSMGNMFLLMFLGIICGNVMTIILAELLFNLKFKRISNALRLMFIIPVLVPGVVGTLMWLNVIFSPSPSGFMNTVLRFFGMKTSTWYFSPDTIVVSLLFTGFPWVAGTSFLIYLAGLQGIPESVFEAAKLDGITTWKRLIYIDFPMILSQIKYFIVTGIIGGFQNYYIQYMLKIPEDNPAMVPGYLIYVSAFNFNQYGYACAIGLVLFLCILIVTIINNKYLKSTEVLS